MNRKKRAHSPQLAEGLASESENDKLPYGRRFLAACYGELQFTPTNFETALRAFLGNSTKTTKA